MNLSEASHAVINRGFDYLQSDQLTLVLNAGKDTFEDIWQWPWLETYTSGLTPLAIPDLKLILSVSLPGIHHELLELTITQMRQDGSDPALPGRPDYWWIEGDDTLHVWPGDGTDAGVVYIADSPPLVGPTDTPLIPARYHPLWIDLAVVEAYKDSDNFPAAQALRADVGLRMIDVIARYEVRNRQHSRFMAMRSPGNLDD